MARKNKTERDKVAAGVSRPAYLEIPSPAEQRAMRDAKVDIHLARARGLLANPNARDHGNRSASAMVPSDIAAGVAVSGKAGAWQKENERVKAHYAREGLTLDPKKDDPLKCRPKSSKGSGNGRAFIPWSDKC